MESRLQASSNSPTLLDIEEGRVDIIDRPSAGEQCCHYFRSFIQFLFSYVGLTAMLCAYLLLGAIAFRNIEMGKEAALRGEIRREMEDYFEELFQEATTINVRNWTDNAISRLSDKQKNFTAKSIVFMEYLDDGEKWSFFGSMLFSLTVVSTIGRVRECEYVEGDKSHFAGGIRVN
ncbi:uncharacterized protein LOC121431100 [Lytechinus variegatus]|uniref:uncharacterized protein LOC121431100 n=1 Tax=Lytechinus variegatus TaxID=7654 RepID=UPI001BB0E62E|nr:uncharacterized protein LOC121431100 [Lytechinus variegatus]